jgi:hypothetical protein
VRDERLDPHDADGSIRPSIACRGRASAAVGQLGLGALGSALFASRSGTFDRRAEAAAALVA